MAAQSSATRHSAGPSPHVAALLLVLLSPLLAAPAAAATALAYTSGPSAPATVLAGESFEIELTVGNGAAADDTATAVQLRLTLPADVTYVEHGFGAGVSCSSPDAATVLCTLPDLAPGASEAGSVTVQVASSVAPATELAIDFDLFSDEEADPGVDADLSVDVETAAAIVVTKTRTLPVADEAVPGESLTFEIEVENLGPSDALDVELSDPTPAGLGDPTSVSGCDCAALPCEVDALTPGASCTLTVTFPIPDDYHLADPPNPDPIVNVATVTTTTPDTDPPASTYEDSESTAVVPKADLEVVSVVDVPAATTTALGSRVAYLVTVRNNGPSRVRSLRVSDPTPATPFPALSLVVTPSAGVFSASGIDENWLGLDLGSGGTATLGFAGWASPAFPGATFVLDLAVAPPPGVTDPLTTNDTGSDSNTVARTADLAVTKTNDLEGVAPGQLVPYTIVVSNRGPADVGGATLTDDFDETKITGAVSWSCQPSRRLTAGQLLVDGVGGVNGLSSAAGAALSPDGHHLYVAAAGDDSVTLFRRDLATGQLTWNQTIVDGPSAEGLDGAAAVVVSPDGAHVYVAGELDDSIVWFSRQTDAGSADFGRLTYGGRIAHAPPAVSGLDGPVHLAIAPDGRQIYVAAFNSNSLTTLNRNATNGALTFGSTLVDGAPHLLAGASAVAVTPDGRFVAVAAATDTAVSTYARDLLTGALTRIGSQTDATRLAGTRSLAVSADGASLYATGAANGYLVGYSISAAGALTFIDEAREGISGVSGLAGARGVTLSPDARLIVVHGTTSGSLAVFDRLGGASLGQFDFGETFAFGGAAAGVFAPGGEQVFAVSPSGNRLQAFTETAGATCAASGNTPTPGLLLQENLNLPAGATVTFSASATVAQTSGTLVNTASVTAPANATNPANPHPAGVCPADASNDSCTDSDPIGLAADLVVTKTAGAAAATPGDSLTFTVQVSNQGPNPVNNVQVSDAAVGAAPFSSATWTCQGATGGICRTPSGNGAIAQTVDLPQAGSSVTYTIVVTIAPDAAGSPCTPPATGSCVANSATATLPSLYIDPTPGNASATVEVPLGRRADLSVVKTSLTPNPVAGGPVSFQVTVRNCGPSDVAGAVLTDSLPPQVTPGSVSWTCVASGGSCSAAAGTGDLAVAVDLVAGAPGSCAGAGEAVFTIDATLEPDAEGVVTNLASVAPPAGVIDSTQGNDYASANLFLSATADLAIVKDDGRTTAIPGEVIQYTIAVTNNGPDNVVGLATVQDLFPPQLRNVSWTCSSEAPPLGTLTFASEVFGVAPVSGLGGASAVAVSPEPQGRHLYVAGAAAGAVAAFSRDGATGNLSFLETLADGDPQGSQTVDGLTGAAALALSPDGESLYVAGAGEDAVAVFGRNPLLGALTFVQVRRDGVGGVDGLAGAAAVAVSPDGRHVYVAGRGESAIAVFSRDAAASGSLSFRQVLRNTDPGVSGLAAVSGLALSPDGRHLYAVGATPGSIAVFSRDASAASPGFGNLAFVEAFADGDLQGPLAIDRLGGARAVAVSPEGGHLYVAAEGDGAISVFRRAAVATDPGFGRLTYLGARHAAEAPVGPGGLPSGLAGARSLAIAADGQHVYAAGGASDAVVVFQRNPTTGALKFLESRADGTVGPCLPVGNSCIVSSLDGAAGVAVSPAGGHVYVASAGDSAIAAFERAGAPPAFSFVGGRPGQSPPQPVRDGDPLAPSGAVDGIESASAVAVSGDGRCLFALGLGDRAIAAFRRDAASGELHFAGRWRDGDAGVDGLEGPTGLDVFGATVYVTSASVEASENALAVFRHETDPASPEHCQLTPVEVERDGQNGVSGLFGASAVAVSGDGAHVYVASRYPGAVAVFARSAIDGAVTFVERKESGIAGVTGLRGAHGVAISTDGAHVYVAASVDDAIVAFRRTANPGDPATFGRLTQIQVVQDSGTTSPVPGAVFVAGLDRVIGLAASLEADGPGSRNLYAASQTGDALLVFRRNADDASPDHGRLSLRQSFFDGAGGVDGLSGARAVRVSRDGKNVYVAGEDDDALAVFSREEVGGTLTFVEARFDGVGGVDGLDQAYGVAVAPSGQYVYVAGLGDDAIAAFGRVSASRCTGSGVGNLVDTVDIAAGGRLLYTVTATIDPAAVGLLVNEATVTVAGAVTEPPAVHEAGACPDNPPGSDNNFCRDVDQLAPVADLALDKTDNRTVAVPGESLTYRLTVANDGPSNVVGAIVHDDLSAIFPDGATWSCVAAPSGALSFLASYADGAAQSVPAATLEGLDGASGVAISPDGLHAYVTGLGDDAVAVFAIDPATGALTFQEAVQNGIAGLQGLDGASPIVVSADGAHVYVGARLDDTVLAFTRDTDPLSPGFGGLGLLQVVQLAGSPAPIAGSLPVPDLDQPVDLALAPDPDGPLGPLVGGEQLYVAAANANALVVLARNADPLDLGNYGLLSYVTSVRDGEGADGLAGASGVALSPDGLSLYATGENEHALAFFARDPGTGALTYREVKRDGEAGVDGLAAARDVQVSGDGANVYVAGPGDGAVAVFARELAGPNLGSLTFVQVARDGAGGFEGLAGANALAVAPDGFNVYVSGGGEDAVAVLRRDAAAGGTLAFVGVERQGFGQVTGLAGPAGVALTPDGRLLLATGRLADAVVAFARPVDSFCSGGAGTVLHDVVNIAAGSRIVYTITGILSPSICAPPYPCATPLVNQASVAVPPGTTDPTPGNNTDIDQDDISVRVNLQILKTDDIATLRGLEGARAAAVSPDGRHLYAVGQVGDAVVVLRRDLATGALTFRQSLRDGVGGVDGLNGAAAVAIDPTGVHVYVAGSADNAVAVFRREADSASPAFGELTFVERLQNGFGGVANLLGPSSLALTDDGRFLYAAASGSSAVVLFHRNVDAESGSFGKLAYGGAVVDGVNGVDGLGLVRAVALAGPHLYAAAEADSAVAAFTRDPETGLLTFLHALFDGAGGVNGLAGARALAVAPGPTAPPLAGAPRHLYVAGGSANAVAVFARQADPALPSYGHLSFVEAKVDGVAGMDGLAGAAGVAVAPDPPGDDPGGQHVYVAGAADNAIAVFVRDADSGTLTYAGVARNGVAGIDGVGGARGLAFAPDGLFLHVAGASDGALAALRRAWDSVGLAGTGLLTQADAAFDGSGTVAPGDRVTYRITVRNLGPSSVQGATVRDIFPAELEDVEYSCVSIGGAVCNTGTFNGDLVQPVSLTPGSEVVFTAEGQLKPDASGTVVNTATVTVPSGVIELDPSDNTATDADTDLAAVADLAVEKIACTDPLDCDATATAELVPGTPVHYQVRVTNLGPSSVKGARVRDILPEALVHPAWSCVAAPVPGLLRLPPAEQWSDGESLVEPVSRCGATFSEFDGLAGVRYVALAPDGRSLYAVGGAEQALAVFRRDLRNGHLAFVEAIRDGDTAYDGGCAVVGTVDGLTGGRAAAVSPDDAHVYVVAEGDDSIATFRRDSQSSRLTFVEVLRDGVGGVNGLGNAAHLALSPDGKHVYTAAAGDNGVGIFSRAASTGALSFVGIRVDGASQGALTLDGLAGAAAVAVSPDGAHVYVAGEADHGVAAFSRAAASGQLTFLEAERDGVAGVDGLAGASALALSPDGRHLYVAAAGDGAVAVFARDAAAASPEFGRLAFVEALFDGAAQGAVTIDGLAGARAVEVSGDGQHVYVAGATADAVAFFARDAATGALAFLGRLRDGEDGLAGLDGVRGLAVDAMGENVYAAASGASTLSQLSRQPGSRCSASGFGPLDDRADLVVGGTATYLVEALLAPSATGQLVNLASVSEPTTSRDPDLGNQESVHVGLLTPVANLAVTKDDGQEEAVPGLPISYEITIVNQGPSDLGVGEVTDLLPPELLDGVWACVATSGLSFVEAEVNGVGGVAGLDGGFAVALAPDPDGPLGPLTGGQHLYVASRASHAVAHFVRDLPTGGLDFVASYADGTGDLTALSGASGVAVSPDSRHLYVTAALDDAVTVFARDPVSGALTFVQAVLESDPLVDGLDGAIGVTVSPDGRHVYVTGEQDDAVVAFARDEATGALTFVEREKDGFGGIPLLTLTGAVGATVTPDGRHLLVAAPGPGVLALFARDAATGGLSYLGAWRDGVGGVDGLAMVQTAVVSPSGHFVYTAGLADDAIAVFARDADSGGLTFLASVRHGVGGVVALDGVRSLALSPDGQYLFAAAYNSDAVAVFRRHGATGLLVPYGFAADGIGGVDGLDGARSVAVSPDGLDLYVVGEHDDAIAVLRRTGRAVCGSGGEGDLADLAEIAVGGVVTYTVTALVDPGATGTLTNEVCVTVPQSATPVCASDTDLLTPQADLSIGKSNGVAQVVAGTGVVYTIQLANAGPSHAPASVVDDPLPAVLSGAQWSCTGADGAVCGAASGAGSPLGLPVDLPVGSSATLLISAMLAPDATGTLVNSASVAPAAGVEDLLPANNVAVDSDLIVQVSDLAIAKSADQPTVYLGEPISFTVTVTNLGPSAASGLAVVDFAPTGLTIDGFTATGWSCTIAPPGLSCTLPDLMPGTAPTIAIDATAPDVEGSYANAVGVSAAGTDPVSANDSALAPFTVVAQGPQVTLVDTVPSSGGVASMDTLAVTASGLRVGFDLEMFDPAGDGDPADVTNPANYRLIDSGPDHGFATASCGPVVGDDLLVPTASVAYDPTLLEALLAFEGSANLADALYRLDVCDALESVTGANLDGDGDGNAGGDYSLHFRIERDNLLARSHFDFPSDLAAWPATGQPGEVTRDAFDHGGFPLSGSVRLANTAASPLVAVEQCFSVPGGVPLASGGRLWAAGGSIWPEAVSLVEYFGAPGCTGPILASSSSLLWTGDTGGLWRRFRMDVVPPSASLSARLVLSGSAAPGESFTVHYDELEVRTPLFADGFETGAADRWSAVAP